MRAFFCIAASLCLVVGIAELAANDYVGAATTLALAVSLPFLGRVAA